MLDGHCGVIHLGRYRSAVMQRELGFFVLGGVVCLVEKDKWPVTQACKVELRGTRKKGRVTNVGEVPTVKLSGWG